MGFSGEKNPLGKRGYKDTKQTVQKQKESVIPCYWFEEHSVAPRANSTVRQTLEDL